MNYKEVIWKELGIWQRAYPREADLLKRFALKLKLEIELQTDLDSILTEIVQTNCPLGETAPDFGSSAQKDKDFDVCPIHNTYCPGTTCKECDKSTKKGCGQFITYSPIAEGIYCGDKGYLCSKCENSIKEEETK